MSRSHQGGQAIRAVALLPGVVGAYEKAGGGALLMTAAGFGIDVSPLRTPSGPATTRAVNHSRLGHALLTLTHPPIRGLFIAGNNPAVTCPDAATVRRGLAREDLFTVVHDPFLSDTARYADIVLPAATYLETEDIHRAYGTYYVQVANQAIAPHGDAWPNRKLAQELARRLGSEHAPRSEPRRLIACRGRPSPSRGLGLARVTGPLPAPVCPEREVHHRLRGHCTSVSRRGCPRPRPAIRPRPRATDDLEAGAIQGRTASVASRASVATSGAGRAHADGFGAS